MKRFAILAAAVMVVGLASSTSEAQVVFAPVGPFPVTTFYAPAPVTTFYAPAPVPVTSFYAPGPVVVARPAVVPPRYFFPGQPVRNFFRRPVAVW